MQTLRGRVFGIIRPCSEHACPSLRAAWQAHLCGLCLTLRDGQGHGARLTTNYDTLIISVLTEAQRPSAAPRRVAGPCALRGFRSAEVVRAQASGARLAAAVSLVLAAGRLRDHVADGETAFGTGRATGLLARRWEAGGARLAAGVGFDTAPLTSVVDRQVALERHFATAGGPPAQAPRAPVGGAAAGRAGGGSPLVLELTAPTEDAVAAAFAHTAVLAGRPGNAAALAEAGRFFGRIAHLLDAAEDRADDDARGAFNPLTATGTTDEQARRLCDDAAHGLALALREVRFEERHLVDTLLGAEVRRAVSRTFHSPATCSHNKHPRASRDPATTSRDPATTSRESATTSHKPASHEPASHEPASHDSDSHESASHQPPVASYERPGWIRKSAAGVATFWTCGVWRPRWSEHKDRPWDDRCYLRHADCGDCSGCSDCGDCCDCCRCCRHCDSCDCDGGCCDCSC